MMKSFMLIKVKGLWVVDPAEHTVTHIKETDTIDGFYVNDDGDLLMRRVRYTLRMFYLKEFWFRKESHANSKAAKLEKEDG